MSNVSKRRREGTRPKIKSVGDHKEFLNRITKTLYYGQLPTLACLSLPVTEISCELWSVSQRGRSLRRLRTDAAASVSRAACVSPATLVLALLYLERLRATKPAYLAATAPDQLFLVSLMVGNKFLQDDGEDDEVLCSEWAASGGVERADLKALEVDFLKAMDWNIFVSDDSFFTGLRWLERQVAFKQSHLHGFFTYTDLAVTSDTAMLSELVRGLTSAWLAAAAAYLAGFIALLASTLVISQTWLPLQLSTSHDTTLMDKFLPKLTIAQYIPNSTLNLMDDITDLPEGILDEEPALEEKVKCCTKWLRYQESIPKKMYEDAVYDWKNPWWSKMAVLNWLYQSSLVNPMQRWLERINEYADVLSFESASWASRQCYGNSRVCRQQVHFSKLSAVYDR